MPASSGALAGGRRRSRGWRRPPRSGASRRGSPRRPRASADRLQRRLGGELARDLAGRVPAHAVRDEVEAELRGEGVAVLVDPTPQAHVRALPPPAGSSAHPRPLAGVAVAPRSAHSRHIGAPGAVLDRAGGYPPGARDGNVASGFDSIREGLATIRPVGCGGRGRPRARLSRPETRAARVGGPSHAEDPAPRRRQRHDPEGRGHQLRQRGRRAPDRGQRRRRDRARARGAPRRGPRRRRRCPGRTATRSARRSRRIPTLAAHPRVLLLTGTFEAFDEAARGARRRRRPHHEALRGPGARRQGERACSRSEATAPPPSRRRRGVEIGVLRPAQVPVAAAPAGGLPHGRHGLRLLRRRGHRAAPERRAARGGDDGAARRGARSATARPRARTRRFGFDAADSRAPSRAPPATRARRAGGGLRRRDPPRRRPRREDLRRLAPPSPRAALRVGPELRRRRPRLRAPRSAAPAARERVREPRFDERLPALRRASPSPRSSPRPTCGAETRLLGDPTSTAAPDPFDPGVTRLAAPAPAPRQRTPSTPSTSSTLAIGGLESPTTLGEAVFDPTGARDYDVSSSDLGSPLAEPAPVPRESAPAPEPPPAAWASAWPEAPERSSPPRRPRPLRLPPPTQARRPGARRRRRLGLPRPRRAARHAREDGVGGLRTADGAASCARPWSASSASPGR